MVEQRKPAEPDSFQRTARVWNPAAYAPEAVGPKVATAMKRSKLTLDALATTAWYAAVDELVGDHCKLVFSEWPHLDAAGRLSFDGDVEDVGAWFHIIDVRHRVDVDRATNKDDSRPIRIGDVFAVQTSDPASIDAWTVTLDISGAARRAAKMAAFAARTGPIDVETAQRLDVGHEDDDPDVIAPPTDPGRSAGPVI